MKESFRKGETKTMKDRRKKRIPIYPERVKRSSKHHISTEVDITPFDPKELGLMRLDIACGNNKRPGFTGIDIADIPSVDIKHDLTQYPWPIESGSVFELHCSHYIEHVQDTIAFMDECYRILMNQGVITILAPYYTSIRAVQDPTHVKFINEVMFSYFSAQARKDMKLEHYPIKCDFNIESFRYYYNNQWLNRADEAREYARLHYWNVVEDIEVILRKIGK